MVALPTVANTCLTAQLPLGTRSFKRAESGYVALQQAVLDASSDTLALVVASHPDDQWMLPATYLRFKLGYRVAVMLFTRGKGGQNSVGPETGDALGRIRTIEAENSASHLGARVFYLNRPDNGYSRSAGETLEEWGEQKTLRDLARLIRKIQPDLVMTTHHLNETHGHDLALLRVLSEATALSADTTFETPGHPPFVVTRLFRGATKEEEDDCSVSLEMDLLDPARGKYFRQLAYAALEENKSGYPLREMDALFPPILEMVSVPIGSQPIETSLLDRHADLFTVLRQSGSSVDIAQLRDVDLPQLRRSLLDLGALSKAAIALQKKLGSISAPPGSELERRLRRRMEAIERVILHSAGVRVSMRVPRGVEAAPGEDMPMHVWIGNAGRHEVTDIQVAAVDGGSLTLVGPNKDKKHLAPQDSLALKALYRPPDMAEADIGRLFSRDTFVWPLRLQFQFAVDGQPISIVRDIQTGLQPAVKLTVMPRTLLLPSAAENVLFVVAIERKTSKPLDLMLHVNPPAGMVVVRPRRQVAMAANERFKEFTFTLKAPNVRPGVSTMHIHIGSQRVRVNVHKVDVRVSPNLRVGLIPGVDDTSYEVLQALIGDSRLEKFEPGRPLPILDRRRMHTIVVDIRALSRRFARMGFARLLDFVKEGGRLVVFYHKDQEFNADVAHFRGAPYPLRIGKGRVTRQDAPVKLLVGEHVLFRSPNRIRPEDWDGWKQERGLYFPQEYDRTKYTELLEMNDPGLPAERGSLLYARYGAGDYIYCALSLYRQLKNRHPGACRLFANLVSPPGS